MSKAFSVAARKLPRCRSAFDQAVLAQLHADYAKRTVEMGVVVEAAGLVTAERAAVANKAALALEAARKHQAASATELRERELEQHEIEADVTRAREAEQAAETEVLKMQATMAEAKRQLEEFHNGPLRSLEWLISRRSDSLAVGTTVLPVSVAGA